MEVLEPQVRWLSLDVYSVKWLSNLQLENLFLHANPDCVLLTTPDDSYNNPPEITRDNLPNFFNGPIYNKNENGTLKSESSDIDVEEFSNITFIHPSNSDSLSKIEDKHIKTNCVFITLQDVGIEIDKSELKAKLVNLDEYKVNEQYTPENTTYISPLIDASYSDLWNGMWIHGCSMINDGGMKKYAVIDFYSDGVIASDFIKHTELGLRSVEGIGYKTRERILDAGFSSISEIASTEPSVFADETGMKKWRGERVINSSRAMENGEFVITGNIPIPSLDNPLFVDIRTDYPDDTLIWQIAVRDVKNGSLEVFQSKSADSIGGMMNRFFTWYISSGEQRPFVLWGSKSTTFKLFKMVVESECSDYYSILKSIEIISLSDMIDDSNIFPPGRRYELLDIATALGFSFGIAGNIKKPDMAYKRWMKMESEYTEPNWRENKLYSLQTTAAIEYIYEKIIEKLTKHSE